MIQSAHRIAQEFENAGVPPEDAAIVADVLIAADVRGIQARGSVLADAYLSRIRNGRIAPKPLRTIVHETQTSLVIDAGNGLGPPSAAFAMNAVIEKAQSGGGAFAAVRNSNDLAFAGYYAMMALPHEMIGIAASTTARYAPPTFGREILLGANPLAFAVPTNEEPPFVLDFATTTVPWDKLEARRKNGEPIPESWSLGDALLPLGGAGTERGGHKGYGLGLLVDILAAALSAGTLGTDLPLGSEDPLPGEISHFLGAFRIDGFRDAAAFKSDMDALLRDHKQSEKAPGHLRIYLAGEQSYQRSTEEA
jgi:L-2-hydroxycarboxylate dehydrogenase (NAD+)